MRRSLALLAAVLVSGCSLNLAVPEDLAEAALKMAKEAQAPQPAPAAPQQPPAGSGPAAKPTPSPVPSAAPTPEPPKPSPASLLDCETLRLQLLAEERDLLNGLVGGVLGLDLDAKVDALYAKYYEKYPDAECLRTPAPEAP